MTRIQEGLETIRSRLDEMTEREDLAAQERRRPINVGESERWASLGVGSFLTLLGLGRRGLPGLLMAGLGANLIYRGATGYCGMYQRLGVDTAHPGAESKEYARRGIHVKQSCLVNKPAREVYQFWRDFENLPRFIPHLESVRVIDEKHSHWAAKAPTLAGGKVEWDAELTCDEADRKICWQSLAEADIHNAGSVEFIDRGERGTMVTVTMDYIAPAGQLGKWVAKLTGREPQQQVQESLRNFKRVLETGEIPTIQGQPHGTCTGRGEFYYE